LILADTSIWIDHFRSGNKDLQGTLNSGQIVIHLWIVAELALGSLRDRAKTLAMLDLLAHVRLARTSELRRTIEARRLYNLGIGLTAAHLIGTVFLDPPTLFWTKDKQLRKLAESFARHANLP
jgi:predicted nucleic acid-binding protein